MTSLRIEADAVFVHIGVGYAFMRSYFHRDREDR